MSLTSDGIPVTMPVAPSGGYGNSGSGFFGGDGLWVIILFFIFAWGWGGNGFGGGYGGGNGAVQGALTRGDLCMSESFQDVKREIANTHDAVNVDFANLNSTICNQQYDTARMINGLSNTVQQGFNTQTIATLQGQNALQTQIAGCCCDAQQTMSAINNNISSQGCDTRYALQTMTRDIITNQNDNARAVLDKLTAQEIAAKDAQITAQQQQIFGLQLKASQGDQTTQIINTLRPFPVASYQVCNPFTGTYGGYQGYGSGCGCNVGCGCGAVA